MKAWYELINYGIEPAHINEEEVRNDEELNNHFLTCKADGFCIVCQSL